MNNVAAAGPPNNAQFSLASLVRLLRPGQWIKNGFVLAPLVFAGKFTDRTAVLQALAAFVLFCLAASITYVINDIRDVESDRLHPTKSLTRPLASGAVSLVQARYLAAALGVLLAIGLVLFPPAALVILGYLALTFSYTFWLKHQPVIDLFAVASGFVLRVARARLRSTCRYPPGCLSPRFAWRCTSRRSNDGKNCSEAAKRLGTS